MKAAFLFFIILICSVRLSYAEQKKAVKNPLKITSESMIAEDKKNIITFIGSVIAQKDDIRLYSNRLVVHYTENRKVKHLTALGKVRLIQDNKDIKSDKAEYFPDKKMIIFTGSPIFMENSNTVSGTSITYYISAKKIVVENSRVILK